MAPEKIFITGIAGFIGFNLALKLKELGYFVVGIDNFNTYYDPDLKKARASLLEKNAIAYFEADIQDTSLLNDIIKKYSIDCVVHLAAQAGVRYSIENPRSYVDSNLVGFYSVLEAIRHHPSTKLVYASSSSVYGKNTRIPFSEVDSTDQPVSFYGATKKANEVLAHSYSHLYNLNCIGLRFFTVYGPFGRPDMAYFSFTKAILEGTPISVFHGGQMQRDFTYIDDIVSGVIGAIHYTGSSYEIFNLGNNCPETLENFIALIEKETGRKAVKNYLPMQPGDVVTTYADISKSQSLIGFNPKTSLEEGLKQFVRWYKEYYFNKEK